MGVFAMAECSEGNTTPSFFPRVDDWSGDDGRDAPAGAGEEGGEGAADIDASEFLERALPLRYTPEGTWILDRSGSLSTVGMFGRSAYVK